MLTLGLSLSLLEISNDSLYMPISQTPIGCSLLSQKFYKLIGQYLITMRQLCTYIIMPYDIEKVLWQYFGLNTFDQILGIIE